MNTKNPLPSKYKMSLLTEIENSKLSVIDANFSNVSYNQLKIMNYFSDKLENSQKKYDVYGFVHSWEKSKDSTTTKLDSDEILFLLYFENKAIGYGLVRNCNHIKNAAVLKDLYIEPEYQSAGRGTVFLQEIEKILKDKYNIGLIYLNCLYKNPVGKFYINNNYKPVTMTYVKKIK